MDKIIGTEVKLKLVVTNIENVHLCDTTFDAIFYADDYEKNPSGSIMFHRITKGEMKKSTDDSYICLVDSSKLGTGIIKLKMTIYVPDVDCPDGQRTEIIRGRTNINIIN